MPVRSFPSFSFLRFIFIFSFPSFFYSLTFFPRQIRGYPSLFRNLLDPPQTRHGYCSTVENARGFWKLNLRQGSFLFLFAGLEIVETISQDFTEIYALFDREHGFFEMFYNFV